MNVFQKNKPFFFFLLKFAGSYIVLSVLYSCYLSRFDEDKFETDGITIMVAKHSADFVNLTGNTASVMPHKSEACYRFFVNNALVLRIVEGCNAVSVMILFVAFICAFSTTLRRTALFILAGIVVLYVLNILRIGLLALCVYYYRDYKDVAHDILFPLFIYGVVFLLWIVWVTKLSGKNGRKETGAAAQ
jgi:exosortase family protein XrtF